MHEYINKLDDILKMKYNDLCVCETMEYDHADKKMVAYMVYIGKCLIRNYGTLQDKY